jgi:hypothetical protein
VPEQDILRWAVRRAYDDPLFLGHEMHEYSEMNEMTEIELARYLECSPDALTKLALCLRPDPGQSSFRANVEQIAKHCGASSQRIAVLLREVDAIRAMRKGSRLQMTPAQAAPGLLMAARDRRKSRRKRSASRKR